MAVASTELRVRRVPSILMGKSVLKAGEDGNIGRSARFECWARGYPDVKFKWKQPSNVAIGKSSKYEIEERSEAGQVFVSVLTVREVASSDYGAYLCEARSEIGAIAEKAVLSGKRECFLHFIWSDCLIGPLMCTRDTALYLFDNKFVL